MFKINCKDDFNSMSCEALQDRYSLHTQREIEDYVSKNKMVYE